VSAAVPTPARHRTSRVAIGTAEVFLHRVLSDAESAAATRAVLDPSPSLRRQCWYVGSDLVTIGAPLYRNRDRPQHYAERARATNRLLYRTYQGLYDRVADFLEERYAHPVSFVDELAIPGFHLMVYDHAGRHAGGGWHFDQLAQQVPFFVQRAGEIERIVNFTLPLAVPSGGTGMDITEEGGAEGRSRADVHVPYRPGVVLLNERELRHRIGASTCREEGECRLTLQGHGVLFRGRLLLFW
jgi:hypothetical protein